MDPLTVFIKDCVVFTFGMCIWYGIWTLFGRWAKSNAKEKFVHFAWIMGGFPALLSVYVYVGYAMKFSEAVKRALQ